MAITDNLILKVRAEAGQTIITDSLNGAQWSSGSAGSLTLINDGTYGYLWRLTGGLRSASLSGFGDWTGASPKSTTIAVRLRITNRSAAYTRFLTLGQSINNGQTIGNAGVSSGPLKCTAVFGGSGVSNGVSLAYTSGDVITLVYRFAETGTSVDPIDVWKGMTGRVGTTPDGHAENSVLGTTLGLIYADFNATSETLDILNFAAWNRGLSDAEAASVADDIAQLWGAGNAAPTFPGPNIGNQTGTVGVVLSANTVSDSFSDTDTLTFSAIGSWPPGISVSSAGVISGTPTTAGTYSGLSVRATDTAAQTVDSDTFTFTISAASTHLIAVANSQQVNTASSAAILPTGAGTITLPALKDWSTGNVKANETGVTLIINNATTGALVNLLTGQTTNASGVLPTLTGLVSGTAYRITTILADGSEGTWKYTAA